jgi:hypothetical protein
VCTDQGTDKLGMHLSDINSFNSQCIRAKDSPLGKIAVSLEIGYRMGLKFRTDDQPKITNVYKNFMRDPRETNNT